MTGAAAAKYDNTYVDEQLALKTNQSTTHTKTETDTALGLQANVSDMAVALATQATTVRVYRQFALKASQLTTYQNRGIYIIRAQG